MKVALGSGKETDTEEGVFTMRRKDMDFDTRVGLMSPVDDFLQLDGGVVVDHLDFFLGSVEHENWVVLVLFNVEKKRRERLQSEDVSVGRGGSVSLHIVMGRRCVGW